MQALVVRRAIRRTGSSLEGFFVFNPTFFIFIFINNVISLKSAEGRNSNT
jgi:hypothetical protein